MNIALVRARYNPTGGAERFAERALDALLGQDTTVSVIARSWRQPEHPAGRWLLVRCDPFYLGSIWRDWSFARAVRRIVDRAGFDLVQSHERIAGLPIYRAGDGVHASWLARRLQGSSRSARWAIRLNPHHWYLRHAERAMFEHPALRAVICNSTLVMAEIRSHFRVDPGKLHLIPNGIDLAAFSPELRDRHALATRASLGIPALAPLLVFVGSGFERKGLLLLLEALAGLSDRVHLVVVGSDKRARRYQREASRRGLAARVHFTGPVPDPRPYLGAADVLVLPTLYDPFPNVVLEALASGVPVVTSDACGAIDVIRPGLNGWIHRSGSATDLGEKLEHWLDVHASPEADLALRHAARTSVLGHGSTALGEALVALYRQLLAEPPASVFATH